MALGKSHETHGMILNGEGLMKPVFFSLYGGRGAGKGMESEGLSEGLYGSHW